MPRRAAPQLPNGFRVSLYDRVAGLIIALLIIVGLAVTVLVLLWLAGRAMARNETPPVELLEERVPGGMAALGAQREFVDPGVEEFADVQTPQLADTLAAVTTAVTTQEAALDEMFGAADVVGAGQGAGHRDARGGSGQGQKEVVPRWDRFQMKLSSNSLRAYARQLDHFRIEIGVLGGGVDGITYVLNLSAPSPTTRRGFGDEENRLYFAQDSTLKDLDRQLLAKAGVDSAGRTIVYFVPADVENTLARLEREYAGGRPVEEIQRTVFGVQSVADGYEFYVLRQDVRPRP